MGKNQKNFLANSIYGNSLYLRLSFSAMNLKLLQKLALKKFKKSNSLVMDGCTESVDNTLKKKEDEPNSAAPPYCAGVVCSVMPK